MNDMEPKFFAEFNAVLADTPLDQVKTYLRWHLLHAFAGTSMPDGIRPGDVAFLRAHPQRRRKAAGTLEALHQPHRRRNGRSAGPGLCVPNIFRPTQSNSALEMTLAIEQAMDKDIDSLDWMSPETKVKAKEKLHTVMNKIGLSR